MARTNKYTSLNFNEIYEKKFTNNKNNTAYSSSSSTSSANNHVTNKTIIPNSRIQGHMLVLTRPTPKPIPIPQNQTFSSTPPDQTRPEQDSISLRPQGLIGSCPALISSPGRPISPSTSPLKTGKFVPPHLRPGFVGREEKPGLEFVKGGGPCVNRVNSIRGHTNRYEEDQRPKTGDGHERMRRRGDNFVGVEVDRVGFMDHPGSIGARPRSSG